MKDSILDTIKKFDFPFRNSNSQLFVEDHIHDLKNHLISLNIDDENAFLNQISVENAIQKIKNFQFKEPKNGIKIVELKKEDLSKEDFTIYYQIYKTNLGNVLIASTEIGVCYVAFETIEKPSFPYLKEIFPKAKFINKENIFDSLILDFLKNPETKNEIPLHIKGTPFQMNVWNALLKIPFGTLTSYGEVAKKINKPKAFRAVGTAVGKNPISVLIPCHRVLQNNGNFGGYMWGLPTKFLLIGWEGTSKK